jgi:hypothetical protein
MGAAPVPEAAITVGQAWPVAYAGTGWSNWVWCSSA